MKSLLSSKKNDALYGQHKLAQIQVDQLFEVMPDPVYYSRSSRVQSKINKYETEKANFKQGLAVSALGLSYSFASDADEEVKLNDFQNFLKEKINNYTETFINKMTQGTDSKYVSILAKLLKSYFEALPTSQKAEIIYRLMQLPLQPKSSDVFLTMIQNTGPQMQKLVQIIGRNPAIPEQFRLIFQKLESQVQPVPWADVKQLISSETNMDEFSYFEHTALGVGTMAQTHRVQRKGLPSGARTFVIRFLKPGIEQLLEMDHEILIKLATEIDSDPEFKQYKLPSLRKQVEDVHESVVEELDLATTVENQRKAKAVYETSMAISFSGQKNILQIHVPDTIIFGKNKKLMQQEIIFGKKVGSELSAYKEIYPDLYAVVAEKLTEHWLEQAFFKSGFFHADLHQGNLLMRVTDDSVQVNLLDFGMVGSLTQQQRDSVLLLALGLKMNNTELIAESFSHLTRQPMDEVQKRMFLSEVIRRVDRIKYGNEPHTSFEEWAAWALTKGIDLHYEFVKLNRGIMAISSLLEESKSSLTFEDVAFNVVLRNKTKVMSLLSKQDIVRYNELFDFGIKTFQARKSGSGNQCRSLFM